VVVGSREEAACVGLFCSRLSFIGLPPAGDFDCDIKIRYRSPERAGRVRLGSQDSAEIAFEEPVWGASPGQLAVFYDGERVIGGGTIDRVVPAA
jgi:tRNA-specific 2-thiouridylase